MYSSNKCKALRRVQVDFSRTSWRQFARLNHKLGARFIRAFVLRHELALFLAEHEASGYPLDTTCQEIRYEDGVFLLLRKTQGVWYITDIFVAEEAVAFEPVYCWQRIKRGASFLLAKLFLGWRQLTRKAVIAG